MQAPGDHIIRMTNTLAQAVDSRDALARHLYHGIFRRVVERTNRSIGFREGTLFCGVLDIFGFEFFEKNTFEQLCINFTNELLQQYFNSFIFENETKLYRDEGISWDETDFPNNGAIVDLLQQPPTGIFPMLDEECFVVGGSSSSWHSKLLKAHDGHTNFGFLKHVQNTFVVKHFAGPVTYTVGGFLEKNRDRLSPDIVEALGKSRWSFVRDCFAHLSVEAMAPAMSAGGGLGVSPTKSGARGGRRTTESMEFRQQLRELMAQIRTTSPHFVRCIKPNPKNRPFAEGSGPLEPKPLFDRPSVAEQLRYQGVLEAIRVARAGYPVRFLHADFLADFRCLVASGELRKELDSLAREASRAEGVEAGGALSAVAADEAFAPMVRRVLGAPEIAALLGADGAGEEGSSPFGWSLGRSRLFLKQGAYCALKAAQSGARHRSACLVQALFRGGRARAAAAARRRATVAIQARRRGLVARRVLQETRVARAVEVLVASFRTRLAVERLRRIKLVAVATQSWARMRQNRVVFLRRRAAVVRLQAWCRARKQRQRMRRLPQTALLLQRWWRGSRGRRRARDLRLQTLRFRGLVRSVVRLRRRREAYRRWRVETLAAYRAGMRAPSPRKRGECLEPFEAAEAARAVGSDGTALGVWQTSAVAQDYLTLERDHSHREAQVAKLRLELQILREKVDRAKAGGFLYAIGLA